MNQPVNPFSMSRLGSTTKEVVTVKARRITLTKFTKETELTISRAFNSSDDRELTRIASNVLQKHILVGGKPISNWDANVSLVEESDMIWLLRNFAYGDEITFKPQCAHCRTVATEPYTISCNRFKRYLEECSDEECPCHAANLVMDESDEQDAWKVMEDYWFDVPHDHLLKSPPEHCYEPGKDMALPQDEREMHDGLKFYFRDLMASDRDKMAKLLKLKDEATLAKILAIHTRRIVWKEHGIDTGDVLESKKARHNIARTLAKLESMNVRDAAREYPNDIKRGVDTRIIYECPEMRCGAKDSINVPVAQDFLSHRRRAT